LARFEILNQSTAVIVTRGENTSTDLWRSIRRALPSTQSDHGNRDVTKQFICELSTFLARAAQVARVLGGSTEFRKCIFSEILNAKLSERAREGNEVAELLANKPVIDLPSRLNLSLARLHLVNPHGRRVDPKPFQLRDINKMLNLSHSANFSVPGAGKTLSAILVYESERSVGRVDRLMVVAPLSAYEAWRRECAVCLNPGPVISQLGDGLEAEAEVLLVNYQRLTTAFEMLSEWLSRGKSHLILDEAHRMKRGADGEWGSACLRLAHLATRRDVLTGTPAPQHPSDLIAILNFLWPQMAPKILPGVTLTSNLGTDQVSEISERLGPFFVRTTKEELGLPEPEKKIDHHEMKPLHRDIYEAITSRMRNYLGTSNAQRLRISEIARVSAYLLQAATNPALLAKAVDNDTEPAINWPPLKMKSDADIYDKICGYLQYELPRKFEHLASIVNTNARLGRKTLVWSNFVSNIEILADSLLAQLNPAVIFGAIRPMDDPSDPRSRQAVLRRFREDSDCHVLIANPSTIGEGVSLHDVCHDAVYLERTFNAGEYLQSVDRIHRLGLETGTVTNLTFLQSRGTIDEVVEQRLRTKVSNLGLLLSDRKLSQMSLPDDDSHEIVNDLDGEDGLVLLNYLLGTRDQ